MATHEFVVVERLPACRIAVHESRLPAEGVTNKIDIGPLFPLFFASAQRTYTKETGQASTDDAVKLWMGPARYHLPPTIRWICRLPLVDGSPDGEQAEAWMAVSQRVVLAVYENVRDWAGGLYASAESRFDTTVADTWAALQRLLAHHDLTAVGAELLVENFQATNHGGWDRYRVMVEISGEELQERGWQVQEYGA